MTGRLQSPEPDASQALISEVRRLSRPLRLTSDLDPLIGRLRNARVVLLGEASHGTHEYYTWRTAITQRLVEEAGFSFIAVEGDWPDCYQVNRFLKGHPGAPDTAHTALRTFRRWPTWMWANEEIRSLSAWLRTLNVKRPASQRVGFYGLDVYSLWDSLHEVTQYLRRNQPAALESARRALHCFEPFGEDAQEYARSTALVPQTCEKEVIALLQNLRSTIPSYERDGDDGRFMAEQNALVVKNAEAYYRAMVRSDRSSWNIRDRHMAETLDRLLLHHGHAAKAIVWEHNTHVGDAQYTDMADAGMVNVGQLAREAYGEERVGIVGFSSHRGTVIAGDSWDAPWEEMPVPAARPDSWDHVLHLASSENKLLLFDGGSSELELRRGQRAIGVVYHPERERFGNYVPTVLPRRYDALLHIDSSTALRPLFSPLQAEPEELPETFPSGV